jgi:prepilin peptidase CpaA
MDEALPIARHTVLLALLVVSAYTDVAKGKLYNYVTLPAAVAGLVLNYWLGGVWGGSLFKPSLVASLIGFGVGGGILLWPYLKGGIGAGDLKLMAAVGALGAMERFYTVHALFYASLVGAGMALAVLIWRGRLREGLQKSALFLVTKRQKEEEETGDEEKKPKLVIPYGLAISIGSMVAWFLIYARPRS